MRLACFEDIKLPYISIRLAKLSIVLIFIENKIKFYLIKHQYDPFFKGRQKLNRNLNFAVQIKRFKMI